MRRPTVLALLGLAGLLAAVPRVQADVLPRAPREAQSRLSLAREAAAMSRYSEAVRLLDNLLAGEENGFIASPVEDGSWHTLRDEATALLLSFPPEGRKQYEFFVAGSAARLLEQAAAQRDLDVLEQVARGYPTTDAAAEALLLLSYNALDRGRPSEALAWLGRLARSEVRVEQVEPEQTLATATAWLMRGQPDRAQQALGRLASLGDRVRFHVGGATFTAADDPQRVMVALADAMRPAAVEKAVEDDTWRMFRGDAARQSIAQWSGAIGPTCWKVDGDKEADAGIRRATLINRSGASQGGQLPAAHPLVVESLVLARTTQRLVAIDRASGRQVWEYPWGGDPAVKATPSPQSRSSIATAAALTQRQRAYDDAAYGQFATDGRMVFLLDGLTQASSRSTPVVVMLNGRPTVSKAEPKSDNRLVALHLRKEGKLTWSVGAASGEDEPALAGAFFLGPPLVVEDELHILAEIGGEIRLCTLEAATGRLRWSLLLAVPERPITSDPLRRLAGATPSLEEGILICPTSAGAVVAVDRLTRSLRWGYQYPAAANSNRTMMLRMAGMRVGSSTKLPVTSVDATATIVGDRVILAPVESEELLCLDLRSGGLIWKRDVDNLLMVAAVSGNTVMTVGSDELSAWDLASGKPAWQEWSVKLPDGASVSGRGFLDQGHYYLPTTAPAVLKIDVATGRIVKRMPLKSKPGNLVAVGPLIVSQSVEAIEAFRVPDDKQ